jgi:hypothetical protein
VQKYLIVAAGILASLIVGATVFREPVAWAAQDVTATLTNVDGNGNVKVHEQGTAGVHEQGTANVNVQNTVPVNGSVTTLPPHQRAMQVAADQVIGPGVEFHTGFRDTSDCRALAVYVNADYILNDDDAALLLSPTGNLNDAYGYAGGGSEARRADIGGSLGAWYFKLNDVGPLFAPMTEVLITNHTGSDQRIRDAWLICSR